MAQNVGPDIVTHHDLDFRPYIPEEEITSRIVVMAAAIAADYAKRQPRLIAVLNGAMPFFVKLSEAITRHDPSIPLITDTVRMRSYAGRQSSGQIRFDKKPDNPPHPEEDIIIIEDIVDSGLTLNWLMRLIANSESPPASLAVATLVHKPEASRLTLPLNYVGFEIPRQFVIGYGMDYDGLGRSWPWIGVVNSAPELPPPNLPEFQSPF